MNFKDIIVDFANDLATTFPENYGLWQPWVTLDFNVDELMEYCRPVFVAGHRGIVSKDLNLITDSFFLPHVDFKLFISDINISIDTQKIIWDYLKLLDETLNPGADDPIHLIPERYREFIDPEHMRFITEFVDELKSDTYILREIEECLGIKFPEGLNNLDSNIVHRVMKYNKRLTALGYRVLERAKQKQESVQHTEAFSQSRMMRLAHDFFETLIIDPELSSTIVWLKAMNIDVDNIIASVRKIIADPNNPGDLSALQDVVKKIINNIVSTFMGKTDDKEKKEDKNSYGGRQSSVRDRLRARLDNPKITVTGENRMSYKPADDVGIQLKSSLDDIAALAAEIGELAKPVKQSGKNGKKNKKT